ncbi:MAG: hypothetical protein Q9162_001694 [Coniocarpon cinnabarinum]
MDNLQRGRSPSAGHQGTALNRSRSPSAQAGFNNQATAHGADPTLLPSTTSYGQNIPGQTQTFTDSSFLGPDFSASFAQQIDPPQPSYNHTPLNAQDPSFSTAFRDQQGISPHSDYSTNVNPQFLDTNHMNGAQGMPDFFSQNPSPHSQTEDDGLLKDMQTSFNTIHNPHMTQPYTGGVSPLQDQSHNMTHGYHSRGNSLSPSSAAMPSGQAVREWGGIAFQTHRRDRSADAFSELSSHHSPFVDAVETFEDSSGISPNLNGQADPSFVNDSLNGLGDFSISEHNIPHSQHPSPGHSNHVSPHMSPQPGVSFDGTEPFSVLAGDPGPQMFDATAPGMEEFPNDLQINAGGFEGTVNNDMPQINIQFAEFRQPTFNEPNFKQEQGGDALIPPSRTPSRRGRAISDPYATSGIARSSSPARARSPSLGLHPGTASARASRSPSPSGPANGIQKPRDRAASTPSIPAREYMLGLADPDRQPTPSSNSSASGVASSGGENGRGRGQKHPATFQCTLCPKRFTRAYNLRSHLRTHTDERPFVCTVCGKAFARQHDRKRHEGLHSGEKKFVCKGNLSSGVPWGCGRRFARADALGRHFRSEAGRACIKPLLEEEARERRAAAMEQANQDVMHQQQQAGMQVPTAQMEYPANNGPVDVSGMTLPAALLAQYPALAGIQWDAMPPAGQGGLDLDDGDFDNFDASGRSSYDPSSGGELEFEDDVAFDPSVMGGTHASNHPGMNQPMAQTSQMGQQGQHWGY